jgi:hypothetical protein
VGLEEGDSDGLDVGDADGVDDGFADGKVVGVDDTGASVPVWKYKSLGKIDGSRLVGALVGAYNGASVVGVLTGVPVGAYNGAAVEEDPAWPNGAVALQQPKKISSLVGQQSPVRFNDLHAGYEEQAVGSAGLDMGAADGSGDEAVGASDALQQSKNMSSLLGQQSPVRPSDLHTGYAEHSVGSKGSATGASDGSKGSATGASDGSKFDSLQHSKNTLSFVGQQYPVKPFAAHAGADEQVAFERSTGAVEGAGGMTSLQQRFLGAAVVGAVGVISSQLQLVFGAAVDGAWSMSSKQQFKRTPSVVGQQSPVRSAQALYAEHFADDSISDNLRWWNIDSTDVAVLPRSDVSAEQ